MISTIKKFLKENYILMFIIYFVAIFIKATAIVVDYPIFNIIQKFVRGIVLVFMLLRIIVISCEHKEKIFDYIKNKNNIFMISLLVVFIGLVFINTIITKNIKWISILIVAISSYGVNFKEILSKMLKYQILLSIITLVLCSTGFIQDYMVLRNDGTIRRSLGFTYTTILPQVVLFASLIYVFMNKFKLVNKDVLLLEIINILVYFITDSRTEILFFQIIVFIILLYRKINITKILEKMKNKIVYSFLLLPILSLLLVILYPLSGFVQKFDLLLSGRLGVQNGVLLDEGIHLLGSSFDMVGFGLEDLNNNINATYNYIDNEYMQILFINGILIFVFIIFLITFTLKKLSEEKNYDQFIFMYIYLLFAFVNPRLFDLIYSPIIFIMFNEVISYMSLRNRGR